MFVIGRLSRQGPPYRIAVWSGGHETLAGLAVAVPVSLRARFRAYKTPLPNYRSKPSCALARGVRSSAVARPVKSSSKWSAGKSVGHSPFMKLGNWRLRYASFLAHAGAEGMYITLL